eukprot:GEZU01036256.1.p1 GENE.GEZU01036256.1~~GEZU01036256.1.p1  ORF type:complete len:196 (+),score=69.46 GEZU01036256.1:27-590(+)
MFFPIKSFKSSTPFRFMRAMYVTAKDIKIPSGVRVFLNKEKTTTDQIFAPGKRVVVFGVPGAFTPVCSSKHVPSYLESFDKIKQKGVDTVACVAVNDSHVLNAWAEKLNATNKVAMIGDPQAELTKSIGLDVDLTEVGLGIRSKRYSMIVDNGEVVALNVEESPGEFKTSGADTILKQLDELPPKKQ